ncbi:MAG: TAXI family TRAP transporter solute-binding subunit [Rhodospirillales bacterium]|nr:TAXI family TRAP transporter solute-binding subunit [Rhodospirillales bacterium]
MNRLLKCVALGGTIAVLPLLNHSASAQDVQLKLISQAPGASWYSYGSTFGEIISASSGQHKIAVEVLPRGGGMANPLAVHTKAAELGFATANAAVWARDGIGKEFEGRPSKDIRTVVGGLQIAHTTVAARKDYVQRTGNDTFEKLVSATSLPRFVMKPTGSQVPIVADYMFQALGTGLEQLRAKNAITQISTAQIAQMIRDGTADVYIENAPVGQATMAEVTLTTEMVFVPIPQKVLDFMTKLGAPAGVMPAGSYRGATADYINPTSPTILIAHKDVPDAVIYQATKALVENAGKIGSTYPALSDWDPKAAAQPDQVVLDLHPGAARYYREQGWIK